MTLASTAPNPERLLDWRIPTRRHQLTRAQSAFYALSVGVGSDPLDPRISSLVDPWCEAPVGHPAMALVLGYPGFWLGAPEVCAQTGVGIAQILHIDQSVELLSALPAEGAFIGETRVTGLHNWDRGKGALLTSERRISLEETGAVVAICRSTHLLRDVLISGPSLSAPPVRRPPSTIAPIMTRLAPTRPEQALLYRLNGDRNPLHTDPDTARAAGFDRPILHGMCTIGMAITTLMQALTDFDPRPVAGFSVRMSAPVFPGDTLAIDILPEGGFRARALEREVIVLKDGLFHLRDQG